MDNSFSDIEQRLKTWYQQRFGVVGFPMRDIVKLTEELGELAKGFLKGDLPNIKEEIGDVGILLVHLCRYYGWSLPDVIAEKVPVLEERQRKFSEERYSDKGTS